MNGQTLSEMTPVSVQAHLRQQRLPLFSVNQGERSQKGVLGHSGSQAPSAAAGIPVLSAAASVSVCIREGNS